MANELEMDSGALIFATLADVYLSSGMIDEAISILKDGLSRNPTYTLAKIILGRAYYMKDDIGEAVKVLGEVYAQTKNSENTNLYLGHCYKKLGDNEKAINFYENTLQVNPDNKDAQRELQALGQQISGPQPTPMPSEPTEPVPEEVKVSEEVTVAAVGEPSIEQGQVIEKEQVPEESIPEPQETTQEPPKEEAVEVVAQEETIESEPEQIAEEIVERAPEQTAEVQEASIKETTPSPVEQPATEAVVDKSPAPEPEEQPITEDVVEEPLAPEPDVHTESMEPVASTVQETEMVEEKIEEPVTEAKVVPFKSLDGPVQKLIAMRTVKGAFVCSKDGLLIQNYYQDYPEIEELCAMVAAIHNEASDAFKFLDEGEVEKFIIEKGGETICVITAGESLLAVVTKAEAKPGLVFIYARKIIEEIREILG